MVTEEMEEKIYEYIKGEERGVTISDIREKFGINRVTAVKYLEVMKAKELVESKEYGMTKVWFVGKGSIMGDIIGNLLLNVLPEEAKKDPDTAKQFLIKVAKDTAYNVFKERGKKVHERKKEDIKSVLYCYFFDNALEYNFEYEIEEEKDDKITLKVVRCPHAKFTINNPIACYSCMGIKLGILKSLFGIDLDELNFPMKLSEGDPYCIFEIPLQKRN